MFVYEKKLQYPVHIAKPDPAMAARIISQYGGPDGELGASLRYLSQRFAMPCGSLKGLLTDIGTEELGHLEIVGTMIYQLTRNLSCDDLTKAGFDAYFVDHGAGVYPVSAAGMPYSAASMQSKGDPITDLHEDLAAEQKARTTYENLLLQADDPDVIDVLRYLREREIVHYQRFAEGLQIVQEKLDDRNFYAFNISLDLPGSGHCNGNACNAAEAANACNTCNTCNTCNPCNTCN